MQVNDGVKLFGAVAYAAAAAAKCTLIVTVDAPTASIAAVSDAALT